MGAGNGDKISNIIVYDPVQSAPRGRIPFFYLNNKVVLAMKWKHVEGGWWAACVAINPNWSPEDLSKYKFLEFNIKNQGKENDETKLKVRLEDVAINLTSTGAHNSTNWTEVSAGPNWFSDSDLIRISLENLDWTKDAFPMNSAEPNRKRVLQITFGCDQKMKGSIVEKTAMIRDIGFIKVDETKTPVKFCVTKKSKVLPGHDGLDISL